MTTAAYAEKLKQENARLRMWLRAVLKFAATMTANEAFEQAAKWCASKRDETARDFNAAKDNEAAQPLFAASIAYGLAHDAIVAMKQ